MSKFAIGEQVEDVADDRESGAVVAAFPTVDGSRFFTEEKVAFTVTRRSAA